MLTFWYAFQDHILYSYQNFYISAVLFPFLSVLLRTWAPFLFGWLFMFSFGLGFWLEFSWVCLVGLGFVLWFCCCWFFPPLWQLMSLKMDHTDIQAQKRPCTLPVLWKTRRCSINLQDRIRLPRLWPRVKQVLPVGNWQQHKPSFSLLSVSSRVFASFAIVEDV